MELTLDMICIPSEDIVARVIEDELVIVPLTAGIGDADDELYTMNETGKAIWLHLDGGTSLRTIVEELTAEFNATSEVIAEDVLGLVAELVQKKIVVVQ